MHKNRTRFQTLILAGLAIFPQSAYAQTVDYSGLEELFGEPVTTSATGQPQKVSDAPVNMEIITADDIRRSGAENIPQILGRLVGVVNWQQTRAASDVGIHGQNYSLNPTLLVLVNGRQIYTDIFGFTQWNEVPVQMEEIKQIEVVKGANAALFGFNAVSGVINIITYNPKYDEVGNAGIKIGTDGYRKAHLLDTVKFSDSTSVRFSGGMQEMDQYDLHSKTNMDRGSLSSEPRYSNINMDGLIQLSDKTQLRLEAGYNKTDTEIMPYYYPTSEDAYTAFGKTTLTSNTKFGLMEANIYQNHLNTDYGGFYMDNRVTVAQLQDVFRLGNEHTFRIMGEYRHNTTGKSNLFGPGADVTTQTYAASGMWNWRISPAWELTNALRFDTQTFERSGARVEPLLFPNGNSDFDNHIDAFSANSGLVWKATPKDNFRLSFARGVQPASHVPMGSWISYFGVLLLEGNPRIKPTYVNNYELGYDRKISAIDGTMRSAVFYREIKSIWNLYTVARTVGSTTALSASNIGSSSAIGVDFTLDGKFLENWNWDVNYAFQDADDDLTRSYTVQSLNYQDTVPQHIANAHLGWAKGPWEVDGYAQYGSTFKAMRFNFLNSFTPYDMDHYFTSGGRVAYTFDGDVTLALSGVDISQARVANNPGIENERQLFLSVSKKF